MKLKLLFILFASLLSQNISAQNQKMIAKFIIQDARINKIDISERVIKAGAYVVIYETKTGETYMATVMDKDDTQTFGEIFDVGDIEKKSETEKEYASETYSFRWSYKNSQDEKRGTARVSLSKIFKPTGTMFSARILLENLDLYEYKGYMEGTIKLD